MSPPLPTITFTFVFDGELWAAEAFAVAVGSAPPGGEVPLVSDEAVAWALFDCPTVWPPPVPVPLPVALPLGVPLPTSTFTFPFWGAVCPVVAPA
jgi:hypothetical protein